MAASQAAAALTLKLLSASAARDERTLPSYLRACMPVCTLRGSSGSGAAVAAGVLAAVAPTSGFGRGRRWGSWCVRVVLAASLPFALISQMACNWGGEVEAPSKPAGPWGAWIYSYKG